MEWSYNYVGQASEGNLLRWMVATIDYVKIKELKLIKQSYMFNTCTLMNLKMNK